MDFPTKGSIKRWFLPDVLISPVSFIIRTCRGQMTPLNLHHNGEQIPLCNPPTSKTPSDTHCYPILLSSWFIKKEGSKRWKYFKNLILSHPVLSPESFFTFWQEWFWGGKWKHRVPRHDPFSLLIQQCSGWLTKNDVLDSFAFLSVCE